MTHSAEQVRGEKLPLASSEGVDHVHIKTIILVNSILKRIFQLYDEFMSSLS